MNCVAKVSIIAVSLGVLAAGAVMALAAVGSASDVAEAKSEFRTKHYRENREPHRL